MRMEFIRGRGYAFEIFLFSHKNNAKHLLGDFHFTGKLS